MMKVLVMLGTGVISFLLAFSFVTRDEIAVELDREMAESYDTQCVGQMQRSAPNPARAKEVCGCMETEFAREGYELTDAFGSARGEMGRITASCMALYR